jgi:release factor glutamine methyltransferase
LTDARAALADATQRLKAAGIESARADARLLLAHVLGLREDEAVQLHSKSVPPAFEAALRRRLACEPIAYITGRREFWSLDFEVGPGVLIPRPETETLIEQALVEFPDRDAPLRILDWGSGSGCLAIALLQEYRNAQATAVDSSLVALQWAGRNALHHGVNQRLTLIGGDWTAGSESCDLIVSNPPYIASGTIASLDRDVALYEPRQALDGGEDGLDAYRALAPRIRAQLRDGGRAILELGVGQATAVSGIFAAARLETIRLANDLSGIERCLVAQ